MLIDPVDEDAQQVAPEVRNAGYYADALTKAKVITDATGALTASHFRNGYDVIAAVRAKFGQTLVCRDQWRIYRRYSAAA